MFKALGGFLGRLFGSGDNAGKTVDMIRDGLDKIILTAEERRDYEQKGAELYLEYLKTSSDGGHLARRLIGLAVTSVWWCYAMGVGALMVVGVWDGRFAESGLALAEVMLKIVLPSFVAVKLFYFGHRLVPTGDDKK